jgi:plasmid maintenance system antidote protein VapI
MPPEHARLSALLEGAVLDKGSVAALARDLRLNRREVERLIDGERFVTPVQAAKMQIVLGIDARELLLEAAAHRLDENLPAIIARVREEFGK